MQACDDASNRAVTIFCWFASSLSALIKLSHSPNGAACALNTFAPLALTTSCTTTILLGALHSYRPPRAAHHQLKCFFFSVVAVSVSRRYPPNVVLQRETVAMDWRDDPPHEVSAFPQNFLHNVQTSDFILCHLLVSFANSFEGPLRRLSLLPVPFFRSLPTTILHCKVAATHHFRTRGCIRTSLDLFQNLSEKGFLPPLTLYPFLFFPTFLLLPYQE